MITGFSYNTKTSEWMADWEKNNRYSFKNLYKNSLGYFIKMGKDIQYLTEEETKKFNSNRKALLKQTSN